MKKYLILLLCLPLFFAHPVGPTSGLAITANEFWFFVSEPTTIRYEEMQFTVRNNGETDLHLVCGYEQVEGFNVTAYFDWQEINITAGESLTNHYWFAVNSSLEITHVLYIMISHQPVGDPGSHLSVGGGVVNRITYYGEKEGSLLTLEIVDQSHKRRTANVSLYYKLNDSVSWTPIKEFSNFTYIAYFPNGRYLVQAYDRETSIYAEKTFTLENDTTIYLVLELVGFGYFKILLPPKYPQIGINFTINNYVGELTDVNIYAELYRDKELVGETVKEYCSPFPKTTNFRRVIWFPPMNYEPGQYDIRTVIESHGLVIAERFDDIGRVLPSEDTGSGSKDLESLVHDWWMLIFVPVPILVYLGRREIKRRKIPLEDDNGSF